jgi:hypothetical protein
LTIGLSSPTLAIVAVMQRDGYMTSLSAFSA